VTEVAGAGAAEAVNSYRSQCERAAAQAVWMSARAVIASRAAEPPGLQGLRAHDRSICPGDEVGTIRVGTLHRAATQLQIETA
jgi:hypothetical protein